MRRLDLCNVTNGVGKWMVMGLYSSNGGMGRGIGTVLRALLPGRVQQNRERYIDRSLWGGGIISVQRGGPYNLYSALRRCSGCGYGRWP